MIIVMNMSRLTQMKILKASGYFDYDWQKESYKFSYEDQAYQSFFKNASDELEKRVKFQGHDLILTFGGFHSPMMEKIKIL